jgi:hypothetical protein
MPHYKVKIEETAVYTVPVEAANEDEAATRAEALFVDSIVSPYETKVTERDAVEVRRVRAPKRKEAA